MSLKVGQSKAFAKYNEQLLIMSTKSHKIFVLYLIKIVRTLFEQCSNNAEIVHCSNNLKSLFEDPPLILTSISQCSQFTPKL